MNNPKLFMAIQGIASNQLPKHLQFHSRTAAIPTATSVPSVILANSWAAQNGTPSGIQNFSIWGTAAMKLKPFLYFWQKTLKNIQNIEILKYWIVWCSFVWIWMCFENAVSAPCFNFANTIEPSGASGHWSIDRVEIMRFQHFDCIILAKTSKPPTP